MNKKTAIYFIIFLTLAFLIVESCVKDNSIKIGFAGNLSGKYSELGISARNGIMLAIDEVNRKGGINGKFVKLIIKNDEGNVEVGEKVDNELIHEGAVAIIGHFTSSMTSAIFNFKDKPILFVSPTIATEKLSNLDDNFIRVIPDTKAMADNISNSLLKESIKSIAIVYDKLNNEYCLDIIKQFENNVSLTSDKKVSLKLGFNSLEKINYRELASTLIESNCDSILIISSAIDFASIVQQLKILNSKISVIYGSRWSKTIDVINHGGRAVEGCKFDDIYRNPIKTDKVKKFENEYKKKFNREVSFVSIFSYDAAKLLLTSLEKCEKTNYKDLKKTILNIGKFNGLEDDYEINKYGDAIRKSSIVKIENGRFISVE